MKAVLTPTPEELGVLIKATQAVLNQRMDEVLRPLGLTVAQYACLRNLSDEPGITSSELARRSFVSRQSMNVMLQGLEKMGLVDRAEQPGPRRERSAMPATRAEDLLAEASAAVSGVVERMTENLDAKQRSNLHDLLETCHRALLSG
ncbi:MarR family winged helix-turn-helix transcriptional regulator [Propionicimonas sp.]|uniref:MarR family winged helix-turn-helix transcriptional regulator n=1 Tax=Propionicimonas sp. TaxID=1955623 RepID=UPI0039E5C646